MEAEVDDVRGVFFFFPSPSAAKRGVRSTPTDSLIGHHLHMKKSTGHRSFIML